MRLVKRDAQGFYMDGDGIWCEQDGASEKFRGEDIDWFGAIEEALGDACSPEQIRALVQGHQQGRWIENSGAARGFHYCGECRKRKTMYMYTRSSQSIAPTVGRKWIGLPFCLSKFNAAECLATEKPDGGSDAAAPIC